MTGARVVVMMALDALVCSAVGHEPPRLMEGPHARPVRTRPFARDGRYPGCDRGRGGRRYQALEAGAPKYQALYELARADVVESAAFQEMSQHQNAWSQRIRPQFQICSGVSLARSILRLRTRRRPRPR